MYFKKVDLVETRIFNILVSSTLSNFKIMNKLQEQFLIEKPKFDTSPEYYVYLLLDTRLSGEWKCKVNGKINKFSNQPFYVGKGKHRRAYHHFTKSRVEKELHTLKGERIKLIQDETGKNPKVEYLITDITEEEAFKLEISIIKSFGFVKDNSGILTNMANGGSGFGGRTGFLNSSSVSIHQYCPNGFYLHTWGSINNAAESIGIKHRQGITSCMDYYDKNDNSKRSLSNFFAWSENKKDQLQTNNPEGLIYIPYNVPSSKNSKQWTGKALVMSKPVRKYITKTKKYWELNKPLFLKELEKVELPYLIGIHFQRDSKRKYDWVNPVQTILDLMVKYGWLEDDNTSIVYPIPLRVSHKEFETKTKFGGVFIRVFTGGTIYTPTYKKEKPS